MPALLRAAFFLRGEMMRFSIRWLLVAIAYAGLSFAALQNSYPAHQWVRFLTLCILLNALLCIFYRPKGDRPFWVGFSMYGWTYVGYVLWHGGWVHPLTPLLYATMPPPKGSPPDAIQHLVDVGTWLPMPIIACIGGLIARAIYRSGQRTTSQSQIPD